MPVGAALMATRLWSPIPRHPKRCFSSSDDSQLYNLLTQRFLKKLGSIQHDNTSPVVPSATRSAAKVSALWEEYSDLISQSLESSSLSIPLHRRLFYIVHNTPIADPENMAPKVVVLERIIERLGRGATSFQYEQMAHLLAKQNDMHRLIGLFNRMHSLNIPASASVYAILIQALVSHDELKSAMALFTCMRTTWAAALPFTHLSTPYGTLMLPSPRNYPSHPSEDTILPPPNWAIFGILASEYARRGDHVNVDALVAALKTSKLKIMPSLFHTIIDSFVRRRMFSAAVASHHQFVTISGGSSCFVVPDLLYLKNICVSLAHVRKTEEALELLSQYSRNSSKEDGLPVPVQLYTFLMSACAKHQQPDTGLATLQHFEKFDGRLAPLLSFCESLASIAEKCDRVDVLKEVHIISCNHKLLNRSAILSGVFSRAFPCEVNA
ncbi:hypothetical protein BASA60_010111 [Batrachochytrium salamandrivorans]|nr:hypothetical protein BASA60_010111 [Batrachochytrium salamandrivorans]KAH9250746.1 hypothetical protein BASA81_011462 [Batrachochytrium salamandrivorans]